MASRISRRSRCNSASLDLTIVKRTAGSAAVASTSKMDEAMINSRRVMPLWWFLRSPFVLFMESTFLQAGESSPSRRCWARTRPFLEWNVPKPIGKQEDRSGSAFHRQALMDSVAHLLAMSPAQIASTNRFGFRGLRPIRIQARSNLRDAQTLENRRPVFLEHTAGGGEADSPPIPLESSPRRLFTHGKIAVGQALGQKRAHHARPIRRPCASVRARNHNPAQRIPHAPSGASMQRHKVARVVPQHGRKQKRTEEIRGRRRSHRSAETFAIATQSLAITGEEVPRLPVSRARGGTQKPGRRDAFAGKKLELLLRAQRAAAGRQIRKENRPPAKNFDRAMEGILVFLQMVRLGRRSIGQFLRFLLSLPPRGQGQHQHNEAQTRRTVAHPFILAWTFSPGRLSAGSSRSARFGIRSRRIGTPAECSNAPLCVSP